VPKRTAATRLPIGLEGDGYDHSDELMSGTVTIIDTAQTGSDGASGSGNTGASGAIGGSVSDSGASFSNQDFSAVSGNLVLTPQTTGGNGGSGARGANGVGGASQTTGTNTVTQAGSSGGASGAAGAGGNAAIVMSDDSAGTTGAPFAESFYLSALSTGGNGGYTDTAGSGGSGGEDETINLPDLTRTAQGGSGGDGGTGGAAGAGGGATSEISGFASTVTYGTTFMVAAFGGAGETSDGSFSGGSGGGGGFTSLGGDGGQGGAGGSATAALTGTAAADQSSIAVSLAAEAGGGGAGGHGGDGGPAIVATDTATLNDIVWTFGPNGSGGAGGTGGAASASFSGNTLTSHIVTVDIQADGGDGGLGGNGGTNPSSGGGIIDIAAAPGATGAAGGLGAGQIVFTNDTLTVGTGLPGNNSYNSGNRLTIQLAIEGYATDGGSPVAIPLDGAAGGNLVFTGNDFVGVGHSELDLSLSGGGSSTVDTAHSTLSLDGSAANAMTGFTSFDLDNDDVFVAGSGTYDVNFAADPDTLVFLPTSGSVELNGVTSSNLVLDFSGFDGLTPTDVQNDTTSSDGSTFIVLPGGGTIDLSGYTGGIPAGDISFAVACYAAGTRIATPDGEAAVEALRAGHLVRSHFGGAVAVQWIGHVRIDASRHPHKQAVWPIRVGADAFAPGVPLRPLFLSPDHAVFWHDVLIPIRCLINGTSIAQQRVDDVTYYHVELPCHDVLLAENLPAESYLDTGNRSDFANGGPVRTLHPDFNRDVWEGQSCAPLMQEGAEVVALRSYLEERGEALAGEALGGARVGSGG